ncbi:hypothetical protein Deba_2222 [Desulfarculus baarsii DSM 2075]|uniref:Methyltransferase domain-containing protein n=1 Tax=Desulfarculus baarsii (strain ATCC 33931 / DSM 2075 / LMG 7858 / VKM B-1802 / 2st14) TaxID=644282 RepID=E1QJ43_DESB2|nr:hypothetical protein Deba_2222 [Desulfarculus baarsii DSM 2075]
MPKNDWPPLLGDQRALAMATPPEAARRLIARLPPGRALELCCGVGGLTRFLARDRQVLAVDGDPERLALARANVAAMGGATGVDFLCCDLERPAITPRPGLFRLAILDPDWAPAGQPPNAWTDDLAQMRPPADALLRWAQGFRCTIILRLPPWPSQGRFINFGYFHTLTFRQNGREKFAWIIWGN